MKPSVTKHSVTFAGHMTSANFEDAFWNDLRQIAKEYDEPLSHADRQYGNLSSASRLFVLGLLQRSRAH
jgi:predicted DNA-binding ribbon-helix-helix protein